MTESLREKLGNELNQANWDMLKPHATQDALILVDIDLNIVDVAVAIAEDDKFKVTAWLEKGLLKKPSLEQLKDWDQQPTKTFDFVIVQPYVLAKATPV